MRTSKVLKAVIMLLWLASFLGGNYPASAEQGKRADAGTAIRTPSARVPATSDQASANGQFQVDILQDGAWHPVCTLGYRKEIVTQQIDLSALKLEGNVWIRVAYPGYQGAHIDAASLDNTAPVAVSGTVEAQDLALRKLAATDFDVIDARHKEISFLFHSSSPAQVFTLAARIEPYEISNVPFQFPSENLYQPVSLDSQFYTYLWNSRPGSLAADGDLNEALGEPFFKVFCRPASGHPDGDTYGWVVNDAGHLYVAIDFVPDNTMDGGKDYAMVYVKSGNRLQRFKVSAIENSYGSPGFQYTSRAGYQHKVYEFVIPVAALGREIIASGQPLELAFETYGTAAPSNLFTPHFSPGSYLADPNFMVPNGSVNAMLVSGDTLYVGGSFSLVGPLTGSLVAFDDQTGERNATLPRFDGMVTTLIPDGSGGWFVGGNFNAVEGTPRHNLAHLLPSGDLDMEWIPPFLNGMVRALAVDGTKVYVGGAFTLVDDQPHAALIAADRATGQLDAWNPQFLDGDEVYTLLVSGTELYVGGYFTSIGGEARSHLAAFNLSDGQLLPWAPQANSSIEDIKVWNDLILFAGNFSAINGQPRKGLAAWNTSTNDLDPWDPGLNSSASVITVDGDRMYIAGWFTAIGVESRNHLAAFDLSTKSLLAWNPDPDKNVYNILVHNGDVYVTGDFNTIGGASRRYLAAIDASTGLALPWQPPEIHRYGGVLASSGSNVLVGGFIYTAGGEPRSNLAAFDLHTGQLLPWSGATDGPVLALALKGNNLIVGGQFSQAGGLPRSSLAVLDITSGDALATMDVPVSGIVYALAIQGDHLYVGGSFTQIGTQTIQNLAEVGTTTWDVVPTWTLSPNDTVYDLILGSGVIYVSGMFDQIDSQPRSYLAAFDSSTGALTSFAPQPDSFVSDLVVNGTNVFAGGSFLNIGGKNQPYLAELNASTGKATSWAPELNYQVNTLGLLDNALLIGGWFNQVNGETRNFMAAVDPLDGHLLDWDPNPTGSVGNLMVANGVVYISNDIDYSGGFTAVNYEIQAQLAKLIRPTFLDLAVNQDPVPIGRPLTFTATVTSTLGIPNGLVNFQIDTGEVITATLNAGVASWTVSDLPAGLHILKAHYKGTDAFKFSDGFLEIQVTEEKLFLPFLAR